MFSFNLNNIGKPIAKITGGKYDGKTVSCAENNKDNDELLYRNFETLTLGDGAKFEPTPNTKSERDILYIAGPSGSGKSFYTKLYLQNYMKQFPNNSIYMLSKLNDDKSLDGIPLKRIMIDNRVISEPFTVEDFKDSCLILDDIDALKEKNLKQALYALKTEILETGRHFNVSLILTSHLACKGNETKSILNESHSITIFLKSGMPVQHLLKNYMGMELKQIKRLYDLPSRWITIFRGYPMIVLSEKSILFLSSLEN
jgi:hypothetical protein